MSKESVKEERIATASYVLQFFQEVGQLTHNFANYSNLMLELNHKYGGESQKMMPEEADAIKTYCHTIRYYVKTCYIKYVAIIQGIGEKADAGISDYYSKISEQYVVQRKDVQHIVELFNGVIVKEIMKNLLESSQEIVGKLYQNE